MFGKLGAPEILVILVVVILIFGAKRLPGMARSLGQSMRILKSETRAMRTPEDVTTAAGPASAQADSTGRITREDAPDTAPGPQQPTATAHFQDTFGTR
jgi:sec-independent protein translocase protein TatA